LKETEFKINFAKFKRNFCIFATEKFIKNFTTMLQKEFQYYLDNQNELVKKYDGKYLVIKDCSVVGAFDTEIDAYIDASKKYKLGTFLMQKCTQGNEAYTLTFNSRVAFA
jgi:hypothetical protein